MFINPRAGRGVQKHVVLTPLAAPDDPSKVTALQCGYGFDTTARLGARLCWTGGRTR